MRAQIVTAAAVATLLVAAPLSAHHSISRHYHRNQDLTVEGTVVEVLLQNPHAEILMEIAGPRGNAELWKLELDDPGDLARQGIVSGTIRAGDEIVVVGHPARDGSNSLFVERMRRPVDGLEDEDD